MSKIRLDIAVFNKGLTESREKARALIMEGKVYVNGIKHDKPGMSVKDDAKIEIIAAGCPYVSRGGLKLEKAINEFGVEVSGKIAMDIGSSTGGFTDCLLQKGAAKVYSIDSGTAQMAYNLRNDERIIVMEKTNFRYLEPSRIADKIDVAVMDVSFISAVKLMDNLSNFVTEDTIIIILIKPQFEAEKRQVGKGVINNAKIHNEVLKNVIRGIEDKGFEADTLTYSPIKGPKGNIEFLVKIHKTQEIHKMKQDIIEKCVSSAHEALK